MITDYNFKTKKSAYGKLNTYVSDEMIFDTRKQSKSTEDKIVIKIFILNQLYLHVGQFFFLEIRITYVIVYSLKYMKNKVEMMVISWMTKLLLELLNLWNTNALLQLAKKNFYSISTLNKLCLGEMICYYFR